MVRHQPVRQCRSLRLKLLTPNPDPCLDVDKSQGLDRLDVQTEIGSEEVESGLEPELENATKELELPDTGQTGRKRERDESQEPAEVPTKKIQRDEVVSNMPMDFSTHNDLPLISQTNDPETEVKTSVAQITTLLDFDQVATECMWKRAHEMNWILSNDALGDRAAVSSRRKALHGMISSCLELITNWSRELKAFDDTLRQSRKNITERNEQLQNDRKKLEEQQKKIKDESDELNCKIQEVEQAQEKKEQLQKESECLKERCDQLLRAHEYLVNRIIDKQRTEKDQKVTTQEIFAHLKIIEQRFQEHRKLSETHLEEHKSYSELAKELQLQARELNEERSKFRTECDIAIARINHAYDDAMIKLSERSPPSSKNQQLEYASDAGAAGYCAELTRSQRSIKPSRALDELLADVNCRTSMRTPIPEAPPHGYATRATTSMRLYDRARNPSPAFTDDAPPTRSV